MLKNIALICFSFLVFFGLFLVAQFNVFAQQEIDLAYVDLLDEYRTTFISLLPENEEEYQIQIKEEKKLYGNYLVKLKKLYLEREATITKGKSLCNKKYVKDVAKCNKDVDDAIQKNAGDYIEALKRIGKIYEKRLGILYEARKKFTRKKQMN